MRCMEWWRNGGMPAADEVGGNAEGAAPAPHPPTCVLLSRYTSCLASHTESPGPQQGAGSGPALCGGVTGAGTVGADRGRTPAHNGHRRAAAAGRR